MSKLFQLETITLLIITLLGVINGEVTVFYIVYLFWFQELIRTVVDAVFVFNKSKTTTAKSIFVSSMISSFFLLFVYLVFIVVLFGLILNLGNEKLMQQNILVVIFQNWYFNITMLLFSVEYIYFRKNEDNTSLALKIFNRRHIILHLSIILGGLIQMSLVPRLDLNIIWHSAVVVLPFLLLKIYIDKPKTN